MALYINGSGNISPQKTWGENILAEPLIDHRSRMRAVEPDYNQYIDAKLIRRMSRIIKMAITSSRMALTEANVPVPDAIITGTGYGCLEDTGTFLTKMIENKEVALNPTPFIQSTHNTMGSQVALMLQCLGYNQTYAHGAFSFESALLDGLMQAQDNPAQNILIGAVDEITDISHTIQTRFGIFRNHEESSLGLFDRPGIGTLNGEGCIFFSCSGVQGEKSAARIDNVTTWYKPSKEILHQAIKNSVATEEPDLLLLGSSGDENVDRPFINLVKAIAPGVHAANFKHLCGEFPVASAFGCWLAAHILKTGDIPKAVLAKAASIKRIVILNQYFGTHFSSITLSKC